MVTVTVEGPSWDSTGRADSRDWTAFSPVYREGGDGGVITTKPRLVRVVAGIFRERFEPGPLVLVNPDGKKYTVTVPDDETANLWELIAAAEAFPPDTAQEALAAAVTTFLDENPVVTMQTEGLTDSGAAGRAVVQADTPAEVLAVVDASVSGATVLTGTPAQGRSALGSTTVGDGVFTAESALAARDSMLAVGRGDLVINVKDYGAKGNGSNNDTAGINAAIAALVPGATLFFPWGRYMTDGGHVIATPSIIVRGCSGRAQPYNSSNQIYLRAGANADMFTVTANQVTVRDLTLSGNKSNQTGTSRGLVTPNTASPNYLLLDSVWVESFKGDGYSFDSQGGTLSATIVNCESRFNDGYGMRFLAGSTDTIVSTCYIDQNLLSGVMCSSGDLSLSDCHIWGNGTASSGAGGDRDGITFQSAAACRVINCNIETQFNGAGIRFKSGSNRGHIVSNCDIWDNGVQGIYAFSASNCIISGNQIQNNNYSHASGASGAGLTLDTCTAILVVGNQFYNKNLNRQTYCYYEFGTSNVDIRFEANMTRLADQNGQLGLFLGPATKTDLGGVTKYKASDQSVTNSTSLVDDADLLFGVAVGEVWELEGMLFVDGSTTGDLAVRIATPASPSGFWRALGPAASTSSSTAASVVPAAQAYNVSATVGALGAGVVAAVKLEGLVTVTTAGSVTVRWAQQVADATATTVKAGSYLRARRVSQ